MLKTRVTLPLLQYVHEDDSVNDACEWVAAKHGMFAEEVRGAACVLIIRTMESRFSTSLYEFRMGVHFAVEEPSGYEWEDCPFIKSVLNGIDVREAIRTASPSRLHSLVIDAYRSETEMVF